MNRPRVQDVKGPPQKSFFKSAFHLRKKTQPNFAFFHPPWGRSFPQEHRPAILSGPPVLVFSQLLVRVCLFVPSFPILSAATFSSRLDRPPTTASRNTSSHDSTVQLHSPSLPIPAYRATPNQPTTVTLRFIMALNHGDQERLAEARRFLDDCSGKGGSRGRQGHGNNSFRVTPNAGPKNPAQGAWGGLGGPAGTATSALATGPPDLAFFKSRPGPSKTGGAVGANTATPSLTTAAPASSSKDGSGLKDQSAANGHGHHQQSLIDDVMDIDELPQAHSSGMAASRWGPAHAASATQPFVPAPRPSDTNTHHGAARPPSPKRGMGSSMWASTFVNSEKPRDNIPPPTADILTADKPIIDNDWQTTLRMENNERLLNVAADNALTAGDGAAEQQLRKVAGLCRGIVKARYDQDEERERALRAEAQIQTKPAAPAASAFAKYQKAKPAQQALRIGRAPDTPATAQHDKPPMQSQFGQWNNQSPPQPTLAPQPQPQQQENALPRPPSHEAPQGSRRVFGFNDLFSDPEAARLFEDFMTTKS